MDVRVLNYNLLATKLALDFARQKAVNKTFERWNEVTVEWKMEQRSDLRSCEWSLLYVASNVLYVPHSLHSASCKRA